MIYMGRNGRHYLATADTVLELDSYASVLEGATVWLPRKNNMMVVASIARPLGTYKKLGEREFCMAACVLGVCISKEHGRLLELDRADPLYSRYVRWCIRNKVELPIDHLPSMYSANSKEQVRRAILAEALDGVENGELVSSTYLCGRLPRVTPTAMRAELSRLVNAGVLETYQNWERRTYYRLAGGDPFARG